MANPWHDVLRPEQVDDQKHTIEKYARSTIPWQTTPACIVYPETTDDVAAVARAAQSNSIPIYPVSRGCNWGYGDACAPRDGMAIVDLRRMNRIDTVNEELGYAVIEPGVSQGQLFDALADTNLWMDATGAGPDASVVGNALERGFGHTRYGDHVRSMCGLEVVLPAGEIIQTGSLRIAGSKNAHTYPYGLGPDLNGLFAQSNLGIVTKMGLWLMPRPEAFAFFYATVDRNEDLPRIVEALRPLRMAGMLPSAIHIANDLRLFSARGQYPYDATNNETPLPGDVRTRIRRGLTAGAWNLSGSLSGTRASVGAERGALSDALAGIAKLHVISDARLSIFERIAGMLPGAFGKNAQDQIRVLKPNYGLLKGIPTRETLRGAHWRSREGDPTADPREAGQGCLWVSPVMPMRGEDAERVTTVAESALHDHGFDPLITCTLVNDRAMIAIIQIAYDASSGDECDRARACYAALNEALHNEGYHPYRVSPLGMARYQNPGDPFIHTVQRLKKALDPNNILAPGRYIPDP